MSYPAGKVVLVLALFALICSSLDLVKEYLNALRRKVMTKQPKKDKNVIECFKLILPVSVGKVTY
jgi:hypothetical protein